VLCQVVRTSEAIELIEAAIPRDARVWADVGAGDGTFTRALVELLGLDARIYAVDRDVRVLASLARWATREGANVVAVEADFTQPLELPEVMDGLVVANALHFVADAEVVLARLGALVRPGGRVVIVEYDRRRGNRWVPYPIAADRLAGVVAAAGLLAPRIVATRPSAFGGMMYVAAADRAEGSSGGIGS
jgi:ubiquinone/menaquinone biosynthesis C-methylase UbiE